MPAKKEFVEVVIEPEKAFRHGYFIRGFLEGAAQVLDFCHQETMPDRSDYEDVCRGISAALYAAHAYLDEGMKREIIVFAEKHQPRQNGKRRQKKAAA